jgi:uncharacterized protein YciI
VAHILFYEYVDDILERRAAHRDAHLAWVNEWRDDGKLVLAGALGNPPHGAAIVFDVDDPSEVEQFSDDDPYVIAELVTQRRIEPIALV